MAAQGRTRPAPRKRKQTQKASGRRFSAIIGGTLIILALIGFIWLITRQAGPVTFAISATAIPASTPTSATTANVDPLAVAGIILAAPASNQSPALSKQQALFLSGQDEPEATGAGSVSAQYTLFTYSGSASAPASFQATPVWLIHYSAVPEPHPDTSADPHAAQVSHDLYVFLSASSGQELLALWL